MSTNYFTRTLRCTAFDRSSLMLLVIFALPLQPANADEGAVLGELWGVYGTLNYSSWEGLGDVQPLGRGGPFQTTGAGIDFGGYTSIARLGSVWILAGGELGFLGLNSDVILESDPGSIKVESAFEVSHITASMTARFARCCCSAGPAAARRRSTSERCVASWRPASRSSCSCRRSR